MNPFFKKPLLLAMMLTACTLSYAGDEGAHDSLISREEERRGGEGGYGNEGRRQQYPNANGQGAAFEAGRNRGENQSNNANNSNNESQQPVEPYYMPPEQNYGYPAPNNGQ